MARFPTVGSLARAPLEDVLASWSGLGYYRRARTLHAAARTIVEQHGGAFPRTHAELLELPGVGPYTAGAVASIAFYLREPLVDGNVARVFARLFALDLDPGTKAFQSELWDRARRLVDALGPAAFIHNIHFQAVLAHGEDHLDAGRGVQAVAVFDGIGAGLGHGGLQVGNTIVGKAHGVGDAAHGSHGDFLVT